MKRLVTAAIGGTGALAFAFITLPTTVAAEQTDLRIQIMPLACVVDTTATGSNITSVIAPLECEREIFSSPDGSLAEALEQTILESPRTPHSALTAPHPSILSLTHAQPIADNDAIADITASSSVDTVRTQQNIATSAGILAVTAIAIVDGAFFGFASIRAIANSATASVRKVKSVLGK